MNYQAVTVIEPEYLRIIATGSFVFEEMASFIRFVRSECSKTAKRRVLIDCGEMVGTLTEVQRFEGGQKIAEEFGASIKAALVMPALQITKLGEMAAVNRGARLLVTPCPNEALDWLLRP